MKPEVEALRTGRARVEQGWCQKANAKDAGAMCVAPESREARSWCMGGSLSGICEPVFDVAWHLLRMAISNYDPWLINGTSWNDDPNRTQEEVLAAFDRAIALAEKSE